MGLSDCFAGCSLVFGLSANPRSLEQMQEDTTKNMLADLRFRGTFLQVFDATLGSQRALLHFYNAIYQLDLLTMQKIANRSVSQGKILCPGEPAGPRHKRSNASKLGLGAGGRGYLLKSKVFFAVLNI